MQRRPDEDDGGVTEEDDGPVAGSKPTYNVPDFDADKTAAPSKPAKAEDVEIEDLDAKATDAEEEAEPADEAPKKATPAKKPSNLKDVAF